MRPNTLVLGFYDDCTPEDNLQAKLIPHTGFGLDPASPAKDPSERPSPFFPAVRDVEETKDLQEDEYVSVIADALKMGKNVSLARYFNQFSRVEILGPGQKVGGLRTRTGPYVDVWPLNLLQPDNCGYIDTCSLFLLQLACVLQESWGWNQTRVRLFLCVESGWGLKEGEEDKLRMMLKELRISAEVQMVAWDQVVALHWHRRGQSETGNEERRGRFEERNEGQKEEDDSSQRFLSNAALPTDEYICAVNNLIRQHEGPPPAVRFLYLPRPPADTGRYRAYLHQLDLLTRDLGPTLLIHGVTPVITTHL